jgi:hypothetical protein
MKKNYTDEDMLRVIQEVQTEFAQALSKAEAEVEQEQESVSTEETISEKSMEEEVEELYASMEKSEAESHFKAVAKVLGISDMKKSEDGEETKILKSEVETLKSSNEELKKSNEELKKNLEQAISIITKTVKTSTEAPKRKAFVTEMEYIKKSEAEDTTKTPEKDLTKLSKSEISKTLTEKVRSGKLEKKDQEAIVSYYEGKIKLDSLKHLF